MEKRGEEGSVLAGSVPLLIIGAGPYGLAMAAQCHHLGIEHHLLGEPMAFWKTNMPRGMYLRSPCDWHLDPLETYTIEHYLRSQNISVQEADPIPLDRYLDYAEWFQRQHGIVVDRRLVQTVNATVNADGARFEATLDDGELVTARNVLVATGLAAAAHVPAELARSLPAGSFWHTRDFVDLESLAGRSCLIVGGRQSAFEWAALAHEHGAAEIHISHRHDTPRFAPADWSWTDPLLHRTATHPGWYRALSAAEQDAITQHMWRIGRLQLEAWLGPRIDHASIHLWPRSQLQSCRRTSGGQLEVILDVGQSITVDVILLATGYQVDVGRLPFLANGNLLERVQTRNGYPVLDEQFQSTVSGLYFAGKFASQDFGHFFDFTAGVRVSARVISEALVESAGFQTRSAARTRSIDHT